MKLTTRTLFILTAVGMLPCDLPLRAQDGGFFTGGRRLPASSDFLEYGVDVSADGRCLLVHSGERGSENFNISVAYRASLDVSFPDPVPLGSPVNSAYFDGGPSLSVDGRTLYFASSRPGGTGDFDLYVATSPGGHGAFDHVEELASVNSFRRDAGPSISADELTLFFASERSGNREIWMAHRESLRDEEGNRTPFGEPRRLPDGVNDPNALDGHPSISSDGQTLFFFSDRSPNQNHEIWYATRSGDSWNPARRIGSPVNTGDFEFSPTISRSWPAPGSRLYLATNHRNGQDPDIFEFTWVLDCNENGRSDADDIALGLSEDCNDNGVPDACDVRSGILADADDDGTPDTCAPRLIRGDCNADGQTDISDAISTLEYQFLGAMDPPCFDACDVNDDGLIDISDPLALLGVLFLGNGPVPSPGTRICGVDPAPDGLSCAEFEFCADHP